MLPSVDLSSCLWMLAKYHELTNMFNFLSYPFPRPQDQFPTSTTFWFFTTGWKAKRNYCRHCSSLYSCCSNIFIRGLPLVEMGVACETCNGMRNSGILVYIYQGNKLLYSSLCDESLVCSFGSLLQPRTMSHEFLPFILHKIYFDVWSESLFLLLNSCRMNVTAACPKLSDRLYADKNSLRCQLSADQAYCVISFQTGYVCDYWTHSILRCHTRFIRT
jgi:hypothetical protein